MKFRTMNRYEYQLETLQGMLFKAWMEWILARNPNPSREDIRRLYEYQARHKNALFKALVRAFIEEYQRRQGE